MDIIYFLRSMSKKKTFLYIYIYILKLCRQRGQSLEESLRGGNLIENLQIFRINNYDKSLNEDE